MEEETLVQKPLVEQILDKMFAKLEGRKEFDAATIQKLKALAARGDLTKDAQITNAIKLG